MHWHRTGVFASLRKGWPGPRNGRAAGREGFVRGPGPAPQGRCFGANAAGFSPNGDGINDVFRPIAVGYSAMNYFKVFNRWGEIVYNGNTLEKGWDGYYNNKQADLGTYYWEIAFTDRFGKTGFLKGDVTLVR